MTLKDLSLQQGPPQGHSLLQLFPLSLLLCIRLHLDLTLIGIQQLQLLLQLHPQYLTLRLLSLVQTQLRNRKKIHIISSGTDEETGLAYRLVSHTYSLCGEHVVDGMVILLGEDG